MESMIHLAACPFCGMGRCAVRICDQGKVSELGTQTLSDGTHAFVLCDVCHATWLDPDLSACHQYLSAFDPQCPVCAADLGDAGAGELKGTWANRDQVQELGWEYALDQSSSLSTEEIEAFFRGNQSFDI